MGRIKSPCKECERKGCGIYHDECPEYIEYKANVQKEKDLKIFDELTRKHPAKPMKKKSSWCK